jgi:glycosyltransferase involved in cell wall biosynthesis
MRRILFDYKGVGFHSMFNSILENPPQGYEFVFPKNSVNEKPHLGKLMRKAVPLKNNSVRRALGCWLRWYVNKKTSTDADLIFSPHHLIYLRKKPWVVMIEHVGDLCPIMYDFKHFWLYKSMIEKILSSECCKKIMPYLNTEKMTLLENLNCEKFKNKIEVVNLALTPKNFKKEYGKDKISMLFLGTKHQTNITGSFEKRGGIELLEAFKILNKEHNNLELVIAAIIPPYIRNKYSQILSQKNVKTFEYVVLGGKLESIMKNADILLYPGYITPSLTFLDAMSYELPVVATNWRGNFEMVENGKTGFLIRPPFRLEQITSARIPDIYVVKELAEKTSILIEDAKLRQRMGIAGRREIEAGKFSTKRRNEKLKEIFDEAIGF